MVTSYITILTNFNKLTLEVRYSTITRQEHQYKMKAFSYSAYPIDAVGVADSRDGLGFRVGGWDWSRAESRQAATAAAAQAVVSTSILFV